MKIIKEACVESLSQAIQAEKNGADRLELCGDLSVGGITPCIDLIKEVKKHCRIPIKVMIRPRGGSFFYSDSELQQMEKDILYCKSLAIEEVVFGVLRPDCEIDIENTRRLATCAAPMQITFHKAIDETSDLVKSVYDLQSIPLVSSILSSGKAPTALAGIPVLKKMQKAAGLKQTIIAAGKITQENLSILHAQLDFKEYHGRLIVGNLLYSTQDSLLRIY